MSKKAEAAALTAYPEKTRFIRDYNQLAKRQIYQQGYNQAEKDIKSAGLDYQSVLDILMEAMARECEYYRLDFEFGYNPEHITNGIAS